MSDTLTSFTAGDLVISISGDGDGSGTYTDNQASPIVLEELTTSGTIVGQMVLPQTTTVVNGVTEYAISGEYGSSSEGSLQLSADGQSLVIAGYGINAATYNAGGAAVYGNAALAQSTSVPGGESTAVPRVIADISYNGTVDTSTALYNVFNTNNPRSVATVNGTTFYISGQGVKGDTTQGVFLAHDGASSATSIDGSTDTRALEIVNGQLYVSRDSTQGSGGSSSIATYGTTLPTGTTVPTVLSGIDGTVTLTAAQENGINDADLGETVHLSPENYFFASTTVLYVADGGDPKEGGLGDGGLQKWVFNGSTWVLQYTLSAGLDLVADTATSGTTGLIGLTGTVIGGTAYLFATNSTLGDLDQTYVYDIADTLNATSPTSGTSSAGIAYDSFTVLETAAPDTNIRGISFAPAAETTTPTVTSVTSGVTSSGVTVTSGGSVMVMSGGTIVGATILAGGSAVVSGGGVDSGTDIANGATETVFGSASGDFVDGVQLVSSAASAVGVVSNEVILNGGNVELFVAGSIGNGLTVETGGLLAISGRGTAEATVLSGGTLLLESSKATLSGSLTFAGAATLEENTNISASSGGVLMGDQAVISGFGAGDVIDLTSATSVGHAGSAATMSLTSSGGETIATISGGGTTEAFIFAGTAIATFLKLTTDGNGGEEITYSAPPPVSITVASGITSSGLSITSGSNVDVLSGGTLVAATLLSGGFVQIEAGGIDSGSVLSAGGTESVLGSASGDQVYGTQVLSSGGSAVVSNETIYSGGSVELFLAGVIGNALTVEAGGVLAINGRGTAEATVLSGGTLILESPKSTLSGTLTFAGSGALEEYTTVSVTSGGRFFGDMAVISGFGAGDVIDLTSATAAGAAGSAAIFSVTTSGGDTYATVSGGGSTETFIFAGTAIANSLSLVSDGNGGEEIVSGSGGTTSSGGSSGGSAISVTSGVTSSGLVVSGGSAVDVLAGGTIEAAQILSGGSVTVSAGGIDSGSTIQAAGVETVAGSATQDLVYGSQTVGGAISGETIFAGGLVTVQAGATDTGSTIEAGSTESVLGSASGDQVYGTQVLSAGGSAVVSNETIYSGGSVELFLAGVIGNGLTVETGGVLAINGRGTAEATVLNGGTLLLESGKSTLSGTLTFSAPSTLEETTTVSVTSGGLFFGDMAVISGFGAGDVIDLTAATKAGGAGSAATFSITTSGGDTYATVSGGGSTETFIFAGTAIANSLSLVSDGAGGEEIIYAQPAGEWAAGVSGDFDTAANWTGNAVPSGLTNAVIDFANAVVTHDTGNDAVTSLTNQAGDFVMTGGTLAAAFLTNDATMSWTGGALVLNTGSAATATLQNNAGATLTIAANGQSLTALGTGTASVQNAGTILVTGGSGEVDIDVAVDNTGIISVNQGTLSLNAGGTSSASGLHGGTGGVLQFGTVAGTGTGGSFTLTGGDYTVANTVVNGSTLNAAGASSLVFANALSISGTGALLLGSQAAIDQGTLTMTGAGEISGSNTLDVYGATTLDGGTLDGTGTLQILYAGTVGGTIDVEGGYTLANAGRLNWSSGNIVLDSVAGVGTSSGSLVNQAGGLLYITADGDIASPGGTGSLLNAGLMVVYAGAGTTNIDAALTDTGAIQVESGTLSLNGGGSMSGANLFSSPSAVLQFGTTATGGNGTFAITGGAYAIANTVISGSTLDVSGAGGVVFSTLLDVTAGRLTLGSLSATDQDELQQTGGTIAGSGTLSVYGPATLTGGVQTGSGVTELLGTATIGGNFDLDGGRTILNQGRLNWSSGEITLGAGDPGATTQTGTLDNAGVLYVTADGDLNVGAGSGSVLDNSGVLAVLAGSGTTTIDATLDNTGAIQVQSGTLQLNGGGSSAGGNLYVATDAVLQFGAEVDGENNPFTITNGVYDVAQTAVEGGTLDVSAASVAGFGTSLTIGGADSADGLVQLGSLTASAGALNLDTDGTLAGSGFFFVGGDAQLAGGLQTGPGATILTQDASISGSTALDGGRTLQNDATLTWTSGTLTVGGGDASQSTHIGAFSNISSGVVDIDGDVGMTTAGSGFFANAGTVVKSGGLGNSVVSVTVDNAGTVDVSSGTLTFSGSVAGSGAFILGGTATLDLISGAGAGSTMQFAQPGGTLETSVQSTFASAISGFAAGDAIDAAGIGFVSGTTAVGFSGGTLTVSNGSQSAAFLLTGTYTGSSFQLASDGHGGTALTYA